MDLDMKGIELDNELKRRVMESKVQEAEMSVKALIFFLSYYNVEYFWPINAFHDVLYLLVAVLYNCFWYNVLYHRAFPLHIGTIPYIFYFSNTDK